MSKIMTREDKKKMLSDFLDYIDESGYRDLDELIDEFLDEYCLI